MNSKTRGLYWLAGACAVTLGTGIYVLPQMMMQPAAPVAEVQPAPAPAVEPPKAEAPAQVASAPVQEVAEAPAVTASFDTVRVEKTGEAVIAGHAAPGSEVAVKWNGAVVGTATANAEGSFAIVPDKPLTAGSGALTLETTKDGKTEESASSVVVSVEAQAPVVVAKIDPAAPTQVTQAGDAAVPAANVVLGAIDYDEQGNIVFSGRAPAGAPLRFYVDNAAVGDAVADASGAWSFKGASAVAVGTHTLRADALDEKGAVISRAETPFMREDSAKVVAAAEPPQAPAASADVQAPAAAPAVEIRRIVIQPGNNLWRVSRKVYGKGMMYTLIFEANRDQIKNPNRIYPGQIFAAPEKKG